MPDAEWQRRCESRVQLDPRDIPPEKIPFLTAVTEEANGTTGAPLALEGTTTAVRTIIAGETDLDLGKHVARCYMTELENSFMLFCDDPEVFSGISDRSERASMISKMRRRIESAAVMWNLAEAFFQLPSYFRFKLAVSKDIIKSSGMPKPKTPKGGKGIGALYKHVTALETSNATNAGVSNNTVRSYTSPHLEVHTEGYWRRLESNAHGTDREGKPVVGRTWVQSTNEWRARPHEQRTVYIKSSVASAKLRVSEYLEAAQRVDNDKPSSTETTGVLYVIRCVAMKDEVYKVGCTAKSAELRAQELSSATGVPTAFVVVESWQHPDPRGLEKGVHAMLDPYRINVSARSGPY